MSNINTIIEEQKNLVDKIILQEHVDRDGEIYYDRLEGYLHETHLQKIKDWHQQSLIQILEAEVERLKGMKKETDNIFFAAGDDDYNSAIDDQITHLTNIIKEIK